MSRPASRYPAQTNLKVSVPARNALNYLRDVTLRAGDQSSAIELCLIRLTGSATPWVNSGHVWSPAAKGAKGRGRWVRKPGPKAARKEAA
jgi:hypothetical protein